MNFHRTEVTMNYGPPATYSYTIAANYAVGDVIDFYVRVEVTNTSKQFTSFPTQAQFDWTASPPAEERHFFSVLVADSTIQPAPLFTDLFTNRGWMVGTNEWEFGAPTAEELSEQPGNDYPFDSLGSGASPQPNCYFTSTTNPVGQGDPWKLVTEAFDLSGLDQTDDTVIVSYALWFYVRGGQTADKFTVEIGDGTTWSSPIDTVAADGSGTTLQRWIRRRVRVDDVSQHTTGRKLRFSAHHPTGAGIVEAVVDEVRVWGVKDD